MRGWLKRLRRGKIVRAMEEDEEEGCEKMDGVRDFQ
jgi:hypothetical protein